MMPIKSLWCLRFVFLSGALGFPAPGMSDPGPRDAGEEAAYLMVYGVRLQGDLEKPGTPVEPKTIATKLEKMRNELRGNPEWIRKVKARACLDTFGTPTLPDGVSSSNDAFAYYAIMNELLHSFAGDGEVYEAVIQRAYQWVIYRPAYEEEIEYWRRQGKLNFIALVASLEDWARRNQPGLMVTGGTPTISANCEFLTTLKLSPELAREIAAAAGDRLMETESVLKILTPGAEEIVSSGGIHLLVAGSPPLRAAMRAASP